MRSRYADIVKRNDTEPVASTDGSRDERSVRPDESVWRSLPKRLPPVKRGNCSYSRWEYAYFPCLVEMYGRIWSDYEVEKMGQFCRFIYSVSSGVISPYLSEMSSEHEEAYWQYKKETAKL